MAVRLSSPQYNEERFRLTFGQSFFGMNTREINGGHWKIVYFFAAAIPLAVTTVLIPLLAIPTINFLVRHYETSGPALKWTIFSTTFVGYVVLDIVYYATPVLDFVPFVLVKVFVFLISIASCSLLVIITVVRMTQRHRMMSYNRILAFGDIVMRRLLYRLIALTATVGCLVVGQTICSGVKLAPYIAYLIFRIWRWHRAKKRKNLARTSTIELERVKP